MANSIEIAIRGIDKASDVFSSIQKKASKAMDSVEQSINDIPDVDIEAGTKQLSKAESDLERLKESVQNMPNIDLETNTSSVMGGIAEIKGAIQAVENQEVDVKANTKGFMAKIAKAGSSIKRLPKRVLTRIDVEIDNFNKKMDSVATRLRSVSTIAGGMFKGGLLSIAPAIIPMLASMTAGLGGLASAFSSAGTAAISFGAVATSALNDVFKANEEINKLQKELSNTSGQEERKKILNEIAQAQSNLTKAQQDGLKALQDFSNFWGKFAKQFQQPVMDVFTRSLKQTKGLIKQLKPAFQGSVNAVNSLSKSMGKAFKSEDIQSFIEMINANAGPMLQKFGKIAGNAIRGIMNLMVQFAPTGQKMIDKILQLSQAFVKWSSNLESNKGFQKFMNYAQKNGPIVVNFFKQLIKFGASLISALAPVGSVVLKLATSFLKWTTNLIQNNKWIGTLIGIITSLSGVFTALSPVILLVIKSFKSIWGIISKISPVFKKLWNLVGKNLLTAFKSFSKFISSSVLPYLKLLWTKVGTKVFMAFQKFWGIIKKVLPWVLRIGSKLKWLTGPVGIVIGIITTLGTIIFKNWDQIWSKTKSIFNSIGSFLKSTWNGMLNAGKSIFNSIGNFIGNTWDTVWGTAKSVWNSITGFLSSTWNGLENSVSSAFNWIKDTITGAWNDVKSVTDNIWDGITSSISGAVNSVIDSINGMISSINNMSISLPKIPDWVPGLGGKGGGSISFPNIPRIPKLATGGVVKEPTVAQVGDAGAGNPEIVAPQNMIRKIIGEELKRLIFDGGNTQPQTIEVPVNLDGKEIARVTAPHMDKELGKKRNDKARAKGETNVRV